MILTYFMLVSNPEFVEVIVGDVREHPLVGRQRELLSGPTAEAADVLFKL
jgi:hypothetical protein